MSVHEPEDLPEAARDDRDALAPAARDAAQHLRREIQALRPGHDLAAIFMRARELDPSAVSAEAVARAESITVVRPLPPCDAAEGDAAALAPFAAALRDEIVAGTRAAIGGRRRVRRWSLAFGVAAAAAAAVILYVVGPELAEPGAGRSRGVEASAVGDGEASGGAAPSMTPPPREPTVWRDALVKEAPAAETAPAPEAVSKDMSTETKPDVPEDRREPAPERPRKPRTRPAAEVEASSLEQQAQALWQAGELAAAEAKYREIVRAAGRTRRAEFAYGDLFALTRQLRGAAGQVAVWREYLAAFPDGQFADDAHGGLCSRGPAGERDRCWREYLERHPRGAYRAEAEAALAGR